MTQKFLGGIIVQGPGVAATATGATAAAAFRGGTAAVAPTSGSFIVGDYVIGQSGQIYVCTTAGSPGTWATIYPINFVTTPSSLGTAAVGTAVTAARADHVHAMPNLDQLANVIITSPQSGDVPTWDGSHWVNSPPSGGTGGTTPLAISAPPPVGTATVGVSTFAARADHVHAQQAAVTPTGLTGATQPTRYAGASNGTPTTGTFAVGDFVVDNTNNCMLVCSVAGSPGTWRIVGALTNSTTPSPIGTAAIGSGVTAARSDHVHAQQAAVAPTGITGAVSSTRYAGGTASGAPTTGTFAAGDYIVAQDGRMYICSASGSPGTWTTIAPLSISFQPAALGTQAIGTAVVAARSDHVHAMPGLSNLTDTQISSPASGQALVWNGTKWVNQASGGSNSLQRVVYASGAYPSRPTGFAGGMVDYLGPVQPTDWLSGDTWTDNS